MTFTHAHAHAHTTTFAHLRKIINFPLIKSCNWWSIYISCSWWVDHSWVGAFWAHRTYSSVSIFAWEPTKLHKWERGFCLSSTKSWGLCEAFPCVLLEGASFRQLLSCFLFPPDLTLTLLTHFGLCVLPLRVTRPVPDQSNKSARLKSRCAESLFTSLPPLFPVFTSISRSTHSHAQLPRRRGPLPGDACWRKRTRPLPEGQREPGGQTPREDVPGTDGEAKRMNEEGGFYVFTVHVF